MQRRDFLRMAGAGGVVIPTWALLPVAQAQSAVYTGKVLINIHADGGLDQSSWADPRETDGTVNNYAAAGTRAGVAGNCLARFEDRKQTEVERRRNLLCQSPGAEGQSAREAGLGILQFRRASQAPGGVCDAAAIRAGQSRRPRAHDRGAAQADAGLAGQREGLVSARCSLDSAEARTDPRAMDSVADNLMDPQVFWSLKNVLHSKLGRPLLEI